MRKGLLCIDRPEFTWDEIECARQNHRLLTFGMELSTLCNFSCIYCYRNAGKRSSSELDLEGLLDAAQQAIDLGARKVGIVGAGEPTLDANLMPLLGFLHGRIESVSVFTNGSRVDAQLARVMYELGTRVTLKVNGLSPLIHDTLVGKSGAYKMMMRGLDELRNAGYPADGHRITIESVITKTNIAQLPDLWCWCRDNGFHPFFERLTPMGRAAEGASSMHVPSDQLLALFHDLKRIDETYYEHTWTIQPPWPAQRCSRHYYNCLIDAEGNVLPCSGVNISVGNIRNSPLATILEGSPIINDLRHLDQRIKGKCATCELADRCYGCRGAAYHITGDYLASDPLCWRRNHGQNE